MKKISSIKLSNKQARQFILAYQRLLPPKQLTRKSGIEELIKQLGCIQFDPLNKVGENPQLVLQSRIKNYSKELLEDLLYQERKFLDSWDKNMSIYATEDWPYFHRYRDRAYQRHANKESIKKILPAVREAIHKKGPLSSIDLEFDEKVDWAWVPTRAARAVLDSMYSWGELIVHHKVGTRKIYDFAEKYIPDNIFLMKDPNQTKEEYYQWHIKRRISGVGMLWSLSGSNAWLGIMGWKKKILTDALKSLLAKKEILEIEVEGIKYPLYIAAEEETLLSNIMQNNLLINKQVSFIAPLDNLLWDRRLIKELFNFDYVWEVYKPVQERKYGYYVLPVLYGDKFIARCEPICNYEKGELLIKNWWWEKGVKKTAKLEKAIRKSLQQFQQYLNLDKICYNEITKIKKR